MIEIGSEYHLMEKTNEIENNIFDYLKEFYTIYFDSGRSALRALLSSISYKRVLLPSYICESVRSCFKDCKVSYYKIDRNLQICWSDLLKKTNEQVDIIYIHFFNGYFDESYSFGKLKKLQEKYKFLIIEDTTHSLLTSIHSIGDYCICSLRKWFPIPDGGVLYSKQKILLSDYVEENEWHLKKHKAMKLKKNFLEGQHIDKEEFLLSFAQCEKALDRQKQVYRISDISRKILHNIDIETTKVIRCRNVARLDRFFLEKNVKRCAMGSIGQVPLFYTILVDNRDHIKKWMIENRIYCPVHWPLYDEIKIFQDSVYNNAHELSIPIDQRYTCDDMDYIVEIFQKMEEKYD